MIGVLRRVLPQPGRNLDLIGLLALAIVIQPLVPLESWLARDDLVPWTTAFMIGVAYLRADTLGHRPPPSLVQRPGRWWARFLYAWSPCLVPVALFLWYDGAREAVYRSLTAGWLGDAAVVLGAALGVSVGLAVVGRLSRSHRITSWQPPGPPDWLVWVYRGFVILVLTLALGATHGVLASFAVYGVEGWLGELPLWVRESVVWLPIAGLLGLQFHSIGLYMDRPQVRRQRRACGRRDRSPYRPPRFRYVLALLGPSAGLALLALLHAVFGQLGFAQAVVVALHVLAWASVIWPRRTPVAMNCILHEVVPHGGADQEAVDAAVGFDLPPRGALRLNPLEVRRLRVIHYWLVRVRDPRIDNLDDPIRPLWPPPPAPVPYHVLGESSFEPEASSQLPQWSTITIRLSAQTDIGRIGESSAQQRRLVVLRAFPHPRKWFSRAARTYRWEPVVPEESIQIVDATTESLQLRDGDIIVLSTEGVARGFELELGAPVYDLNELGNQRPAQLEDYVGFG